VEVLRLIARRDPVLADKLSSSVSVDLASQARAEPGDQSQQSELSLQLALSIADANPKRAGDVALAALKTGINPLIIPVLEAIRRKDSSQADLVFGKVLAIASRDRSLVNVRILGLYVFPTSTVKADRRVTLLFSHLTKSTLNWNNSILTLRSM
jgi:hypothetical protein